MHMQNNYRSHSIQGISWALQSWEINTVALSVNYHLGFTFLQDHSTQPWHRLHIV